MTPASIFLSFFVAATTASFVRPPTDTGISKYSMVSLYRSASCLRHHSPLHTDIRAARAPRATQWPWSMEKSFNFSTCMAQSMAENLKRPLVLLGRIGLHHLPLDPVAPADQPPAYRKLPVPDCLLIFQDPLIILLVPDQPMLDDLAHTGGKLLRGRVFKADTLAYTSFGIWKAPTMFL